MIKYKELFFRFLLVLSLAAPAWGMTPPSADTPEATLWRALTAAAEADLTAATTQKLMDEFLSRFPGDPRTVNVYYMQGEREFRREDYKSAAVRFEKFLQDHSAHALADSAAFRLGESYYNLKAFISAQAAWEKMIKGYPHSALVADAMEFLTILNMKSGEWGKADEQMRRIASHHASFAQMPRLREKDGAIQYYLKDYTASARVTEGIDGGMPAYFRGLSLFALKLFDEAGAALSPVELEKSGVYEESAAFLKAESLFQKRNYTVAAAQFQSFLARFPASLLRTHAHLRLAACALISREPDRVLSWTEKVIGHTTDADLQSQASFLKGCALAETNQHEGAVAFLKKASESAPPAIAAAALLRQAWSHLQLGQVKAFRDSLTKLETSYSASAERPLAQFLAGARLFEDARWEEAGHQFELMLVGSRYDALSEAALALMCHSYANAGQPEQLVTSAHSVLRIFENNYSSLSPYWRAQAHYAIGRAYVDLGNHREALPFLEKVTIDYADHPLSSPARLWLSACRIELGQYDKARDLADMLLENKKTEKKLAVQAAYLKAISYFNAKDYDKALTHLDQFLKENPKDERSPEASYLLGLSFHQKKVYGSAIDQWTRCLKEYPQHALAQTSALHIGDLYFKAGKYDAAAGAFKEFQALWPDSQHAQAALWQEMQSLFNGKDDESAVRVYPQYVERYPQADNVEDARRQLEMIYYRRGEHGDPDKLGEFLDRYPKSPFAPSARFKLGQMSMEQKAWNRAVVEFERFVQDFPKDTLTTDALYALGQAYENLEQPERAMIQYRHLLREFADKEIAVDTAFRLGAMYFAKEKWQEAVEIFSAALNRKNSDDIRANLLYNMALCYENLGQLESAAVSHGQFARYSKNKDQVRESLLTAGALMKQSENYPKAIGYLKTFLKDPGEPEQELKAVNLLAECQRATGDVGPAIKTYETLLSKEPAGSDLRLAGMAQLAYLYEQRKDLAKAVSVYEKIAVSEGKAEWVKAAQARVQAISENLNPVP